MAFEGSVPVGVYPGLEPRAVLGPVGAALGAVDGGKDIEAAVLVNVWGMGFGDHPVMVWWEMVG